MIMKSLCGIVSLCCHLRFKRAVNTPPRRIVSSVVRRPQVTNVRRPPLATPRRSGPIASARPADNNLIISTCAKVKDRNGPFRSCVSLPRFNAQNEFNLCVTMLRGMGSTQSSICTVLAQIASNCVDVKPDVRLNWKSAMRCR